MPDSLINEVEDRSIDGRKDGAIPSSVSIDKPRIRPARNGHLSRCGDVFWPRIGFQPRQGGLDGARCSDVVTKQESRGGQERFIPARKRSGPAYLRRFLAAAGAGAVGAAAGAAASSGTLAIVKI
jgi:hypothetical protein